MKNTGTCRPKTRWAAHTLEEFLAIDWPKDPNPTPWGRLTTHDGTQYLFDRGYVCFVARKPGGPPEPCEAIAWPPDVVERLIFGDARDRRGKPVGNPWTEEMGQFERYRQDGRSGRARWRNRAPQSRRGRAAA